MNKNCIGVKKTCTTHIQDISLKYAYFYNVQHSNLI